MKVDENHPDVIALVKLALADAETFEVTLTPDAQAEVLETSVKEWEKELRNNKPDGPL